MSEVDFNRPFVSFNFDEKSTLRTHDAVVQPKLALLEFGILLLEIWHRTTFEARFSLEETTTGYYKRLALAIEWLDDMSDPMPELYDNAASRCIRGVIRGYLHLAD